MLLRLRSGGISKRAFFLRMPSRRGNGEYERVGVFGRMRFDIGRFMRSCSAICIHSELVCGDMGRGVGTDWFACGNTELGRTLSFMEETGPKGLVPLACGMKEV